MRPRHRRFQAALYAEEYSPALVAHLAGCRSCQRIAGRLEHIDRYHRSRLPELSLRAIAGIFAAAGLKGYERWAEEGGAQPTSPSA